MARYPVTRLPGGCACCACACACCACACCGCTCCGCTYRCAFAPKTESRPLRYLVITPYRCAFAPKTESICRKLGLQNRKAGRGGENERVGGGAGLKVVTTLNMLTLRTLHTPLTPLTLLTH